MVLTANQVEIFTAEQVVELREKSWLLGFFNRYGSQRSRWQMGAKTVHIPIPDYSSVTSSTRARGGDWPTAVVPSDGDAELTRQTGAAGAIEVLMEDAAEISYDVVEANRSRMMYEIQHDLDTAAYDAIRALPSQTITIGTDGSYFISRSAPYESTTPTGDEPAILAAIEEFSNRAYRLNAIDGEGGDAGTPGMVMHPELVRNLRRELRNKGLSLDALTDDSLKSNVGMASGDGMDYFGQLMGVRIFSWNHLAVPTGNADWEFYAALPTACAAEAGGENEKRVATQQYSPNNNPISSKPAHLFRQVMDAAWVEVIDAHHFKYVIKAD